MTVNQLSSSMGLCVSVVLNTPLNQHFDYFVSNAFLVQTKLTTISPGTLLLLPFGKGKDNLSELPQDFMAENYPNHGKVGMVVATSPMSSEQARALKLKSPYALFPQDVIAKQAFANWYRLLMFVSDHYLIDIGRITFACLPNKFSQVKYWPLVLKRIAKSEPKPKDSKKGSKKSIVSQMSAQVAISLEVNNTTPWQLTQNQQDAVNQLLSANTKPQVLFGVTGSGKTEVYFAVMTQWLEQTRACTPHDHEVANDLHPEDVMDNRPLESTSLNQVLLMVPEINLTPQLIARVKAHFIHQNVVVLHSQVSEAKRFQAWMATQQGRANIIIGTRLAIFCPIPYLAGIIIDEEHDVSYRQTEGGAYSARDLAIWRAKHEKIPVILGSATPCLESWFEVQRGRYGLVRLHQRANQSLLPQIQLVTPKKILPDDYQGKNTNSGSVSTAKMAKRTQEVLVLKDVVKKN